jgi:hypothetical protein
MAADPTEAMQVAAAAALLASAGVTAIVAETPDGPAVFAPRQPFADVFPRITLETPQVLGRPTSCGDLSEVFVTIHSWARGPDATLVAGRLAGAGREALDADIGPEGHRISTQTFEHARPVGDPDPSVEHVVSVFRYLTHPTA